MIRVKPVKRDRSLWVGSYLPTLFWPVWISTRHFFRNLFIHMLQWFGLFKGLRPGVTYAYPESPRPQVRRARSRHRLTKRADGSPRCVACMMCETICPARCISIVAKQHPDPMIEKAPASFDLDLGKCVYCGYCVEACPEDAIRMDSGRLDIARMSRQEMQLKLEDLLS